MLFEFVDRKEDEADTSDIREKCENLGDLGYR